MSMKKRISYLDYVKGLLIIFVVLGHVMPEDNIIHSWIYSWHMPAFFILNGMLLSYTKYEKRSLWGKKGILLQGITKLIIPYYVYGCLLMLARWGSSGFDYANLKWQIIDLGYFWGIGATWFLPCLFLAQFLYWAIKKISFFLIFPNGKINYLLMLLVTLGIMIIPFKIQTNNVIVMVIFRSMIGACFISIGDLLFLVVEKIEGIKNSFLVVGNVCVLLLSCAVFLFTGKVQVSLNILNLSPFVVYISNALIGTMWIFLVVIECERKFSIISKILDFYGKASLVVMGTHQIVMLLLGIPIKMNYLRNIVYCIMVLLAEIPVVLIVNKIRHYREGK